MRKPLPLLGLCLLALLGGTARAQHLVPQPLFDALATEYSGESAQEHTRRIIDYHRIQGSPMMAEAAERVVLAELRRLGIKARLETFRSDGRTRHAGHLSPMGWRVRGAELWVEGAAPFRLCRYRDVPMCLSTYSKGGTFRGELVDVGAGTRPEHYAGKQVRGRVALASGYAAEVVRQAVLVHGAAGVVIYPDAADRPDHPDIVRYNGIWPRAEELAKTAGGFQISRNQYERLAALMRRGPVRVRGEIDATLGPGELTLVHAYLRGTTQPEREVLVTAHLDHPKWSANDNASGSGAALELVRTLDALIKARKLVPRRTLHVMWVPEFSGTFAYLERHPEARRCGPFDDPRPAQGPGCVVANLNLDMVGEDTDKTGSRFYLTRTPHSVPSFLDALLLDVLAQTREANLVAPTGTRHRWPAEVIPYAEGSDHDVLLGVGIPSTMLGHAPDWTHHTSADTLDKTDASEFLRVGVLSSAAAAFLLVADEADAARLLWQARGDRLAQLGERLARTAGAGPAWAADVQALRAQAAAELAGLGGPTRVERFPEGLDAALAGEATAAQARGPRRTVFLPLPEEVLAGLPAAERALLEADEARPGVRGAGLVPPPPLSVVLFEIVNLLDGRRGAAEITAALRREFLQPFEVGWVEHVLHLLAGRGAIRLP